MRYVGLRPNADSGQNIYSTVSRAPRGSDRDHATLVHRNQWHKLFCFAGRPHPRVVHSAHLLGNDSHRLSRRSNALHFWDKPIPQMGASNEPARDHSLAPKASRDPLSRPSFHASHVPIRSVLLHHDGLAESHSRPNRLLSLRRTPHHKNNGSNPPSGRPSEVTLRVDQNLEPTWVDCEVGAVTTDAVLAIQSTQ